MIQDDGVSVPDRATAAEPEVSALRDGNANADILNPLPDTETPCYQCGQNIHASGGDPDWGLCWPCMEHQTNLAQADREYERRECGRCCGNGQTYGPNSGEDIICPDCGGNGQCQ